MASKKKVTQQTVDMKTRRKNRMVLVLVGVFMVLFYLIAIARMGTLS